MNSDGFVQYGNIIVKLHLSTRDLKTNMHYILSCCYLKQINPNSRLLITGYSDLELGRQ